MGRRARHVATRHYLEDAPLAAVRSEMAPPSWVVYAVVTLIVGGLAGYILGAQGERPSWTASSAAPLSTTSTPPLFDEGGLRAYRDILARDPKNLQAAVAAGNLLYDAQRYVEAIPFYRQTFALNPSDVNVSTDLGTALWYSGRPDDALAQYEKSLAINATHAQTLFNVGIVKADGKRDYAGAIASWGKLLDANPTYRDIAKVRSLMATAQQKLPVKPLRTGAPG